MWCASYLVYTYICPQGKDSTFTVEGEKMMEMECKLADKNIDRVITNLELSFDLACQAGALVNVKREDDGDEIKLLKDTVADLKLTYHTCTTSRSI